MIKGEYQLFIPGPIELSGEVLEELAAPMMPHFGTEWAELYKETTALAKQMFQTEGELYIVPGSGSAALDMGIGNLVYGNKSVLVVSNGFLGIDCSRWRKASHRMSNFWILALHKRWIASVSRRLLQKSTTMF